MEPKTALQRLRGNVSALEDKVPSGRFKRFFLSHEIGTVLQRKEALNPGIYKGLGRRVFEPLSVRKSAEPASRIA